MKRRAVPERTESRSSHGTAALPKDEEVWIQADGTVRYLEYSGFKLEGLGEKTLKRVSRIVEENGGHRVIDEATGKDLGLFPTREAALGFERKRYSLNERCSACGTRFHCGSKEESCWCAGCPVLERIAEGDSCLCPSCLTAARKAS